jgi:hypothetical protein
MVVCAWLAADHSTSSHGRHLLEPIFREARLPGIGTEADYRKWFSDANFGIENFEDLSARVRKTWSICLGWVLRNVFRRRDYTQFLFSAAARNRVFLMTMVRIWLAYILGAMRYGIFQGSQAIGIRLNPARMSEMSTACRWQSYSTRETSSTSPLGALANQYYGCLEGFMSIATRQTSSLNSCVAENCWTSSIMPWHKSTTGSSARFPTALESC